MAFSLNWNWPHLIKAGLHSAIFFSSWGYSLHSDSILGQQINKCLNSFCVLLHVGHVGAAQQVHEVMLAFERLIVWLGEMMQVWEITSKWCMILYHWTLGKRCKCCRIQEIKGHCGVGQKGEPSWSWSHEERVLFMLSGRVGGESTCMVNTMTENFGEDRFVGVQDGTVENRNKEYSLDYSSSQVWWGSRLLGWWE